MKKIEKIAKTFFDKFFWGQHPETALRYLPVVKEIKKAGLSDSKILEIGPGSLGIIPYLRREIDGIDVDFSGPKTNLLNKIRGKADQLPFKKNSYDVCISVDVLEHLPSQNREKAIYEMLRVAKKMAIIVVPTGIYSERQDKQIKKIWDKMFNEDNQFLKEHLKYGLPQPEEILVYIDRSARKLNKQAKTKSYPSLNLTVRNLLMRTWITKNRFIYYLYLKGYLLLLPILRVCNFGTTYRRVFVVEFLPHL